ncbi:MAG: CCA tRNA nucleotidyltransferase, partial [Actinomycetota bacterium]
RGIAAEAARGAALAGRLRGPLPPSRVDAILCATPPATACAALAAGAEPVARWWRGWRDARLAISGTDLVAAGVAPGPAIGHGLRAARAAFLDGDAPDRAAQLRVALAAAA